MNLLLLNSNEITSTTLAENPALRSSVLRLPRSDRRARHLIDVLKIENNGEIRIGALGGGVGIGLVRSIDDNGLEIEVGPLEEQPPPASHIEVILALPRPKGLRRSLRALANLGVKSIHLIHSYRVEKSYWSTPFLEPGALQLTLQEGLELAGDTIVPKISQHRLFKPFAQDIAPTLNAYKKLVFHPYSPNQNRTGTVAFADAVTVTDKTVVAIGPEGGFIDYEVGLFQDAGFDVASLGSRILSVETAIPYIVSRLGQHAQ